MQYTTRGFEELIQRFEAELRPLTDEELDRRPADGAWTAREVMGHLIVTIDIYAAKFDRVLGGSAQGGKPPSGPHRPTWIARMLLGILRKQGTDKKKVKAPGMFQPGKDLSGYSVDRLVATHRAFLEKGTEIERRGLDRKRIGIPILGFLRFATRDAYEVQRLHGVRHLEQALSAARGT